MTAWSRSRNKVNIPGRRCLQVRALSHVMYVATVAGELMMGWPSPAVRTMVTAPWSASPNEADRRSHREVGGEAGGCALGRRTPTARFVNRAIEDLLGR